MAKRDSLIDSFLKYDEFAKIMTRSQAGVLVDDLLNVIDMADYVVITKKRLRDLELDSDLLIALQNAGVDNWEGWDEAVRTIGESE